MRPAPCVSAPFLIAGHTHLTEQQRRPDIARLQTRRRVHQLVLTEPRGLLPVAHHHDPVTLTQGLHHVFALFTPHGHIEERRLAVDPLARVPILPTLGDRDPDLHQRLTTTGEPQLRIECQRAGERPRTDRPGLRRLNRRGLRNRGLRLTPRRPRRVACEPAPIRLPPPTPLTRTARRPLPPPSRNPAAKGTSAPLP